MKSFIAVMAVFVLATKITYAKRGNGPVDADDGNRLVRYLRRQFDEVAREVVPPARATNGTTTIKHGLSFQTVVDIDEHNGHFTGMFWGNMVWQDDRLKWNSTKYGGKQNIRLPSSWIWKPDIKLYSSVKLGPDEDQSVLVVVDSSGQVLWVPPAVYEIICSRGRGFDWHCKLKFGSWTYDGSTIDLDIDGNGKMDATSFSGGDWKLVSNKQTRNVVKYDCCPETYVDVTYEFGLMKK